MSVVLALTSLTVPTAFIQSLHLEDPFSNSGILTNVSVVFHSLLGKNIFLFIIH
jgi:hypothetical protein